MNRLLWRLRIVRRSAISLLAVTAVIGLSLSGCSAASNILSKKDTAPAAAAGTGAITLVSGSAASNGVTGDVTVKAAPGATTNPPAKWIQLTATKSSIGTTVTEVHGLTLYRFDKDKNNPPTSNCSGDCATTWPPVAIQPGGAVYVTGVDKTKVSAIKRDDGTVQLTLGGWPMYTFSKDTAPGDLNGQGVGGTWFAFAPDGSKITSLLGSAAGPRTRGAPPGGHDTSSLH